MAEERSQVCFRDKRKTGDCSSIHTQHIRIHTRVLARFPSKNWSNLWGPKIRRNIRHLAFFLAEPGRHSCEKRSFGARETRKWRFMPANWKVETWTYWQGMVDNVFMLILSVVCFVKFIFQEREIALGISGGKCFKNFSSFRIITKHWNKRRNCKEFF